MKTFKFFKMLAVLIVLITSINSAWASQELKGVYMKYTFNGSNNNYEYYSSDNNSNPVLDLGTLTTGTFTITEVYWKTKDNWKTHKINAFGWYNMGSGDTKFAEYQNYSGSNTDEGDGEHEIQNTSVNYQVYSATGNSGNFTFSHWWIANFHWSDDSYHPTYCSNNSKNYNFTFTVLPPNATAITATATSGALSGNGTESNPYLVAYNGSLAISLSGSGKGRTDSNSSVQYSVDGGGTWGTTSSYTSKTISTITATTLQNYVFKSRCYNSDASLASPEVTTKTVYYKVSQHDIDYTAPSHGSYTIKAGSASAVSSDISDVIYGTTITLSATPNDGYEFSSWSVTGATVGSSTSATTTFTMPNNDVTIAATFTEITHTVSFANDGHGTTDPNSNQTVGEVTGIAVSATPATGYLFNNWTITSGTGSFTSATTTASNTFKPAENATIRANFTPKSCTVTFDKKGGSGGSDGTTATYDADMEDVSIPHKIGYAFDGYFDGDNGTGNQYYKADGTSYRTWNKDTESTTTLHAKWISDTKRFVGSSSNDWATASNWEGGVVPTNDYSAITIDGDVTLSSYVHIGQLTIGEGKLTISSTGTLEVAGTVTNTNADKLEIQTTTSSQGALIYDIASPPAATVIMTLNGSGFHLIASPTGGARVSSTFAGSGIYTYAWEEGKGWDRRGYYDDFIGNEAILIYGQTICNFSGTLANYCGGSLRYTTEPDDANAQGVNMLANPLTAPIRIANMTISNSEDGAVHLYNGSWVGKAPGSAGEAVIPAMQGYGVIASSSGGTVSFTYDTAVRGASTKNAPLNAPKRTDSDILDHITVSVTTNDRKVDLELYENEQFTERIDVGWEAIYMEGNGQFGELYAIADKKMNILATPNLEGTVLGFVPGQAESYVISFEGDGKGYYLNDTELELSTLIDEGNTYEFTPNESTNATRFVISKTPIRNTPTGLEEVSKGTKARKQLIDGVLYIIRDGRIYNTTGALYK